MKYKLIKVKDSDGTIYFKMINNKGLSTKFFQDIENVKIFNKLRKNYGKLLPSDTILYKIEFNKFHDLLELVPEEFL